MNAPLVEEVLSVAATPPDAALLALLLITHRLRNNLFHGPKWNMG
jgi:hypothetical protein